MSVMPNTVKLKFAGLLRGLLRRFDNQAEAPRAMRSLAAVTPPSAVPSAVVSREPVQNPSAPMPASKNADEIQLALQPVLTALPMELRAKIVTNNTASMMISIPIEKALAQLATGSVKISFGELRHLAPGVFSISGGEHDSKPVTLPLGQILAQINPQLLARRSTQKSAEVSGEISNTFGGRGQGLTISTETLKAPVATPPPMSRRTAPVSETPALRLSSAPPSGFAQRAISPTTNGASNGHHLPPQGLPQNGNGTNGSHKPAAFDAPAAQAFNSAPQIQLDQPVLAPLAALSESWPESLRLEIVQLNLTNADVALPGNLVEPALKRGRVIFPWRYIRSWIKPTPPNVSVHDGLELELPLKVLAPLFFTRPKSAPAPQKKISVSEEIPNLFFGFPQAQPEAPAPVAAPLPILELSRPAPKTADTNFYVWGENGEVPKIDESEYKRPATPATDFSHRHATPQDVVARAMALPGVAGAVIALPDGLKVASQIPADLNGDTLAAFLPQIFERVNQTTKELRMGGLNNLHFTVGNVPWKIFRVNAVYFAAFGSAGQPLPTAQLALLASELDRKKQ
jgi:predicted regulator of Ras-like GTPase activity (Roadblock/LC7/MglB family)